uniref:Uncharacterized protein n=1 Tax=Sphaerodactylus townsendi TaxID=933632 RepID=A0ACB8G5Y2_9SAUR
MVCVAISKGIDPNQVVQFETINLNSASSWFMEIGAGCQQLDAIHVTQLERDTVLVCLDSVLSGETRRCWPSGSTGCRGKALNLTKNSAAEKTPVKKIHTRSGGKEAKTVEFPCPQAAVYQDFGVWDNLELPTLQ